MKLRNPSWTLLVALVLCATAALAQDQKQDTSPIDPNAPLRPLDTDPTGGYGNQPIGAARGVNVPDGAQPYDPAQVTPDQNTLAGAAPFTLGSLQHRRNIFDPAISFSQVGSGGSGRDRRTDDADGRVRGQRQPEFRSHLERVSLHNHLQRR